MKTIKLIAGIVTVGMLFASCDSKGHEDHDDHSDHSEMESHEGHDHNDESSVLGLNHGEKWEVNSEMMIPVRNMEKRIYAFSISKNQDFPLLYKDLKNDLDRLTSSCTMTGESHDQLHLWLLPHMELVEELNNGKNDEEAQKVFAEIQASMNTFNNYFE